MRKNVQPSNDSAILESEKHQNFIDECVDTFKPLNVITDNLLKVNKLKDLSYLPNAISVATALFFIFYLLDSYDWQTKIILGIVLTVVIIMIEPGKRFLIVNVSKAFHQGQPIHKVSVLALTILIAASVTISYLGGEKGVTETTTPPPLFSNTKLDSLRNLIAYQNRLAESYRSTTWKGRIVENAQKGLNKVQDEISRLNDQIAGLEQEDNAKHNVILMKHEQKTINLGYVVGTIAALCDLFLILILSTIMRLMSEVNTVVAAKSSAATTLPTSQIVFTPTAQQRTANKTADRPITAAIPVSDAATAAVAIPDPTSVHDVYPTPEENAAAAVGLVLRCPHDGVTFTKTVHNKKFCCSQCKKAYWEERNDRRLPEFLS